MGCGGRLALLIWEMVQLMCYGLVQDTETFRNFCFSFRGKFSFLLNNYIYFAFFRNCNICKISSIVHFSIPQAVIEM